MSAQLTQGYLRKRFWLAGITIGLSIVIAIIVGWSILSSFKAHSLYSTFLIGLIHATSEFMLSHCGT
jgi:hypothetical protein